VDYSQVGPGDFSPDTIVGSGTTFSAPAMIENNGRDIAVQGSGNALDIYWAPNNSDAWDPGTVAGPGTTYSEPAMVLNGDGVDMTAVGPDGSLYDYWAENGWATWSVGTVAPPGSVN